MLPDPPDAVSSFTAERSRVVSLRDALHEELGGPKYLSAEISQSFIPRDLQFTTLSTLREWIMVWTIGQQLVEVTLSCTNCVLAFDENESFPSSLAVRSHMSLLPELWNRHRNLTWGRVGHSLGTDRWLGPS